jgi:hypothetical protein
MNKIPTLFVRDPEDRAHVLPEVNAECQWVLDGHGIPRRKLDGTCVMLDASGEWWARREVKPGKTPPPRFARVETDPITGKTVGWEPVAQSAFAKYHAEAVADAEDADVADPGLPDRWPAGTYELIGPKINGNPERCEVHELVFHDYSNAIYLPERSYDIIRECVLRLNRESGMEGIVFRDGDGIRSAKIKARDFRAEAATP